MLDSHDGYSIANGGHSVTLNWSLTDVEANTNVSLYSPSHAKLLDVNWTTKKVYNTSSLALFVGSGSNFAVQLMNLSMADNGTYFCKYLTDSVSGFITRTLGKTLVLRSKYCLYAPRSNGWGCGVYCF